VYTFTIYEIVFSLKTSVLHTVGYINKYYILYTAGIGIEYGSKAGNIFNIMFLKIPSDQTTILQIIINFQNKYFYIYIFTVTAKLWQISSETHTEARFPHVCESPATKLRCDIQFTNEKMYSSFFNSIQNFTSTQCYEGSQSSKTDTNTHPQLQNYPPFQDFITYYCNNTFTIQYSLGYYYRK